MEQKPYEGAGNTGKFFYIEEAQTETKGMNEMEAISRTEHDEEAYQELRQEYIRHGIDDACKLCYEASAKSGWWTDLKTGQPLVRNKGEMLMLMVSEIAEAMEGTRKNLMDDKLPHRKMEEVELADCLIRIFDYAGGHGLDVAGALIEKLAYNAQRADHKPENRVKPDGKKF